MPKEGNNDHEKTDEKFLIEITTHALKSRCACKICHRLRERHLKELEAKVEERK